jgi:phospholipase/lecithinase/hemolysin
LAVSLMLFLGVVSGVPAFGQSFSRITVLGDSLSDVGNTQNSTFGIQPGSGYFDGRFSNGLLYHEYLAADLGLTAPGPSTEGGRNYAYGGAWAGDQGGLADLLLLDLDEQVTAYLDNQTVLADELIVLFAGGNDLIDSPNNVNAALASIGDELGRLSAAGARQFLVPNLPSLGLVPQERGTSDEAPLIAATDAFNRGLSSVLDQFENDQPLAEVYRLDVANLFAAAFADPAFFGLTNVTDEAINESGIDPDTYLFWDGLHPTTAGHRLLADAALAVIPEPATAGMLGLGLALLSRRRSSAA